MSGVSFSSAPGPAASLEDPGPRIPQIPRSFINTRNLDTDKLYAQQRAMQAAMLEDQRQRTRDARLVEYIYKTTVEPLQRRLAELEARMEKVEGDVALIEIRDAMMQSDEEREEDGPCNSSSSERSPCSSASSGKKRGPQEPGCNGNPRPRKVATDPTIMRKRKPQHCTVCDAPRFSSPGHTLEGWCPLKHRWGSRSCCSLCGEHRGRVEGHKPDGYCPLQRAYDTRMTSRWMREMKRLAEPSLGVADAANA